MGRIGLLAAWGLFAAACGARHECPAGCVLTNARAALPVACSADVVAASVIGPCQPLVCLDGRSPPAPDCQTVFVEANDTGTCHVEMRFADGYLYAADIQFVGRPLNDYAGCPPCPPVTMPITAAPPVDDPAGSCAGDGGTDAALTEAGHRQDAQADEKAGDADGDR